MSSVTVLDHNYLSKSVHVYFVKSVIKQRDTALIISVN